MRVLVLTLTGLLVAVSAWTQPVSGWIDPLRPPYFQTRPPADAQQEEEEINRWREQLQLTTILRAPDRVVAIINGRPLQVGQMIGDFRLIAIDSDQVILQKGRQKLTLYQSANHVRITPATDGMAP